MSKLKTKRETTATIQSSLIGRLRLGQATSRVELARQLKLAPSTIGLYVDELIADGFLREGRKDRRTSGRPPTILELNPQAGRFVGIDFEARTLRTIVVDFSHQTLNEREYAILWSDGVDEVLAKIELAVDEITGKGPPLLGVGIAVPGLIDSRRGMALHYRHIRGWRNVPLVDHVSRRFACPIYLENNVRAMALAEQRFGQGHGLDCFLCVGIRSGIAAGLVVDGRLLYGHDHLAGEIGCWPCDGDGSGGANQTLEQRASVAAVLGRLADAVRSGRETSLVLKRQRITLDDALEAARAGDELTREVLEQSARAVGRAIAQFSQLLNPAKVIVAGPLAELGDVFLQPMRQVVADLTAAPHNTPPAVVASQLGAYAGAIGAAALAVHRWRLAT